jgi:hypothetical protein
MGQKLSTHKENIPQGALRNKSEKMGCKTVPTALQPFITS